jgi:hypothetical protein
LLVLSPFALMFRDLSNGWAQQYAASVSIAALALIIGIRPRRDPDSLPAAISLMVATVLSAALIVAIALLTGTSLMGLYEGLVQVPLRVSQLFEIPAAVSWIGVEIAAVGALLAGAVRLARQFGSRRLADPLLMIVKFTAGVVILHNVVQEFAIPSFLPKGELSILSLPLSLAWVVAVMPEPAPAAESLGRVLLASTAVFMSLHAYPVAGIQLAVAFIVMTPVGMLCIADGVKSLPWNALSRVGTELAGAAMLVWVSASFFWPALAADQRWFSTQTLPTRLYGAERMRLTDGQVHQWRDITIAVDKWCTTFISQPGVDSLYLFSRKQPPTLMNPTGTEFLTHAQQQEVVNAAKRIPGLCAVRNGTLMVFWAHGIPPTGPIDQYIVRNFTTVAIYNGFELMLSNARVDELRRAKCGTQPRKLRNCNIADLFAPGQNP